MAVNIMEFARLRRRAGFPVGPANLLAAMRAVPCINVASRSEVRATFGVTPVHRNERAILFSMTFDLLWRHPAATQQNAAMTPLEDAGLQMDFEAMNAAQIAGARAKIAKVRLPPHRRPACLITALPHPAPTRGRPLEVAA